MGRMITVDDYKQRALQILPPVVRDYYKSGAGDELSLEWNQKAFDEFVYFNWFIFCPISKRLKFKDQTLRINHQTL